jgi:hypothetical protein
MDDLAHRRLHDEPWGVCRVSAGAQQRRGGLDYAVSPPWPADKARDVTARTDGGYPLVISQHLDTSGLQNIGALFQTVPFSSPMPKTCDARPLFRSVPFRCIALLSLLLPPLPTRISQAISSCFSLAAFACLCCPPELPVCPLSMQKTPWETGRSTRFWSSALLSLP